MVFGANVLNSALRRNSLRARPISTYSCVCVHECVSICTLVASPSWWQIMMRNITCLWWQACNGAITANEKSIWVSHACEDLWHTIHLHWEQPHHSLKQTCDDYAKYTRERLWWDTGYDLITGMEVIKLSLWLEDFRQHTLQQAEFQIVILKLFALAWNSRWNLCKIAKVLLVIGVCIHL